LESFEVKKCTYDIPTSEFGDQNIKPIFFLIKNKTQINININNIMTTQLWTENLNRDDGENPGLEMAQQMWQCLSQWMGWLVYGI
jgi:hypothetical protein